jgi:cytochrome c oxidase subunit II
MSPRLATWPALAASLAATACGRPEPAGIQAQRAGELAARLGAGATVALLALLLALTVAIVRGRRRAGGVRFAPAEAAPARAAERRRGVVAVLVLLLVFAALAGAVMADVATRRAIHGLRDPDPLTITLTARHGFWEVRYDDPVPALVVSATGEVRLPLGRVVRLVVRSPGEVHALSLPALGGRVLAEPGEVRELWLRADRPGRFAGVCTEPQSRGHGIMPLAITVQTPLAFERWLAAERRP